MTPPPDVRISCPAARAVDAASAIRPDLDLGHRIVQYATACRADEAIA
jgi:hypothetical protein